MCMCVHQNVYVYHMNAEEVHEEPKVFNIYIEL